MTTLLLLLALNAASPNNSAYVRKTMSQSMSVPVTAAPPPFFVFAPASGAGMGTACAGTVPKGFINGVQTSINFARASSAGCLKGGQLTGIANGDSVLLSADQPRVEIGGDGTGGVLGLSVWEARTNQAIRSENLDNTGVWTPSQTLTPGVPTVFADMAISPDGTQDAEEIVFPPTAATEESFLVANPASTGISYSTSFFIRGAVGSGTLDVCMVNSTGTTVCTACAFVSTSWSRCNKGAVSAVNTSAFISVGNRSASNGGTARAGNDVYVWGAQYEAAVGSTSSPYMKTDGTAVTRVKEDANINLGGTAPAGNLFSATATRQSTAQDGSQGGPAPYVLGNSVGFNDTNGNGWLMYQNASPSHKCQVVNETPIGFSTSTTAGVATLSGHRFSCWANGILSGIYGSTTLTNSGAMTGSYNSAKFFNLGSFASSYYTNGTIKLVCYSPDPTLCR